MKIHIFLFSIVLSGCSLRGLDKPSRYDFELWEKPGASKVEVQSALLECGYHSFTWSPSMNLREVVLANLCLERSGFIHSDGPSRLSCQKHPFPVPELCSTDAVIPTRSVERRLNSPVCQNYPKAYACQPPGTPTPTDAELEKLTPPAPITPRKTDGYSTEHKLQNNLQNINNKGMDQLRAKPR
ncbi:hypothetical protein [Zoogloea sp.]|uniref:hypothetical protein n=1 Tax=Zoogloea sp. TaxID=49181 RepID=UPI00263636FC|nr:hypothetical protein [Zoogloea sp.]MDD3354003.1 hypothetical protein [Zoogloea sp.]